MKKVLVIVDYQKDFVDGIMGNAAAQALEPKICEKIETYLSAGDDVVFLMDTHCPEDMRSREFAASQKMHCLQESEGWHLYGKVAEYLPLAKRVIRKNNYGSIELADMLRENDYDVVELAGVTTHSCVFSNAIIAAAAKPFAKIVVDSSCTASPRAAQKDSSLQVLQNLHIQVLS